MMTYEEMMSCLIRFGRGSVHDFIVRSNDVNDAVTYLWVDLSFNLAGFCLLKQQTSSPLRRRRF